MPKSELSEKNYRRIAYINWLLSVPILLISSWPYYMMCEQLHISRTVSLPGSIIFALPFMLTILHGHVTMALGATHRHHYYNWLQNHPLTFGLLFHHMITSTRFRLFLFLGSIILLIFGYFIR
ncbi:MAG: hypothetical protein EA391_00750 [Balneolaceae bacterium]|nr:MAG: hypothetical protein EA391_00750 [Balneolaceae bacterium]